MEQNKESLLKRKRNCESDSEYEEKNTDRERFIYIYRENSRMIVHVKKIYDLFYIIEKLNMPYFYKNKKKLYFNFDNNIQSFLSKKDNKIIYESNVKMNISRDNFLAFHENLKPNKINYYSDFCFPYYYFTKNKKEIFINKLDEEVISLLKDTRYNSEYKIIKLFGPKKSGKSTIVYYYFGIRRYIPLNEMYYIEDIDNSDSFNSKDTKYIKNKQYFNQPEDKLDLTQILSQDNKFQIDNINEEESKKYFILNNFDDKLKREEYLEANADIPNIKEELKDKLDVFSKGNLNFNEENLKLYEKKIFQKEFNLTENDTIGFFRSCYLNNDFFQNKEYSKEVKKDTLYFEFSGLFKSYRIYQFFINKFNDKFHGVKNIIDISEFIMDFMQNYNKENRRYFIILDGITNELLKQLEDFETKVKKNKNCYVVEIFSNKEMNDYFEKKVIENNSSDDELIIYKKNYTLYDNSSISGADKQFISDNFDNNFYYNNEFQKWKGKSKKDNNIFLDELCETTKNDLLQKFTFEEEGKLFYRFILNEINQKISDNKIIKNINLDYFFLKKGKKKYKLETFPFVEKTLAKITSKPLKNIIYEDYFLKLDEYIKGGIFEDIIKQEIKKHFEKKMRPSEKLQELNIKRVLDNEIFTYYDDNKTKSIISSKPSFQSLKSNLKKKDFKFQDKVTILNCLQNAKHYDFGVIFYNILHLYQISINKTKVGVEELVDFIFIDLNYIINKLEMLTDEKNIITEVYLYLVNIDMESLLGKNQEQEILEYFEKNRKNNIKMENAIQSSDIRVIYLSNNCEFYDTNSKKVSFFQAENRCILTKTVKEKIYEEIVHSNSNHNNVLEFLKNSEELPKFIRKDSISFYSKYYPKIDIPNNSILYTYYPKLKKSFIKIKETCYDMKFNIIKQSQIYNENKAQVEEKYIYTYIIS